MAADVNPEEVVLMGLIREVQYVKKTLEDMSFIHEWCFEH
jgi:hypothetical protein